MVRQVARWGAVLVIAGCGQSSHDPPAVDVAASTPVASSADGHRHVLDVDWVPFSEAQIYEASVAIIRGRVIDQRSGFHRTYPVDPETGREQTGDDYAELPLTSSLIEVAERFSDHDGAIAARAIIQIIQLGGRYRDGCWVEPSDQRLLRPNDEVVAFLKPAGMVPTDLVDPRSAYAIVGGQQGMVPVVDGLLDPIPTTVFERYASRRVTELARDLEGFVKAPIEVGR